MKIKLLQLSFSDILYSFIWLVPNASASDARIIQTLQTKVEKQFKFGGRRKSGTFFLSPERLSCRWETQQIDPIKQVGSIGCKDDGVIRSSSAASQSRAPD